MHSIGFAPSSADTALLHSASASTAPGQDAEQVDIEALANVVDRPIEIYDAAYMHQTNDNYFPMTVDNGGALHGSPLILVRHLDRHYNSGKLIPSSPTGSESTTQFCSPRSTKSSSSLVPSPLTDSSTPSGRDTAKKQAEDKAGGGGVTVETVTSDSTSVYSAESTQAGDDTSKFKTPTGKTGAGTGGTGNGEEKTPTRPAFQFGTKEVSDDEDNLPPYQHTTGKRPSIPSLSPIRQLFAIRKLFAKLPNSSRGFNAARTESGVLAASRLKKMTIERLLWDGYHV